MNRQELVKNRRKQKAKGNQTILFVVIAVVIVAVAMVILTQIKPAADIVAADREYTVPMNGLTLGDPNAPIEVIEFADFQCPACYSYWMNLEPTIYENYIVTGKIKYTYSPYSFLGRGQSWDESVKAAEAAYCANDQGKFWEFRDIIFANHNGENLGAYSRDRLFAFAKELGLDENSFKNCLNSDQYYEQVMADNDFASGTGSTFTPSFLLDGQVLNANELIQAIENKLAE